MAFPLSPGVETHEIDLSAYIPGVSSTAAGFAGAFRWGPAEVITLIATEKELVDTFGKPDDDTYEDFYTAANFLAYSRRLRLVRIVDDDNALNATADAAGLLVKNEDVYTTTYDTETGGAVGYWAAKWPGAIGNSLKISVCSSATAFAPRALTGTISATGTAVTGGTAFTTEVVVGDTLTAATYTATVASIESDAALTLVAAFAGVVATEAATATWEYSGNFSSAPGTSTYAANHNALNDEIHLMIIDEDGSFSGIPGTVLEEYSHLSLAIDAKDENGNNSYYKDAINQQSLYVWWMDHHTTGESGNWGSAAQGLTFTDLAIPYVSSLAGGVDGNSTIVNADKITGFNLFKNTESVEVSFLICGVADNALANHVIGNVAEYRGDAVAFVSPEKADVVNNSGSEVSAILGFRNTLTASSYAFMDSSWKYQYDSYNAKYRWVPLCGDTAGICARSDYNTDPWFSPGGHNRGSYKNVTKLAYSPDKADRDDLYPLSVNPVIQKSGSGTLLWGDKTLLSKPSAFDRIGVRRLFIVLKKAISEASELFLFEFNNEITRLRFTNLVEPYLREVKGRQGIYSFKVVCDDTNNTSTVIARNEFIGDIYISPAKSINFITLNFIAGTTGVDFSEIERGSAI